MYELIRAGERTWYIDAPAKMGVFELGGGEVCLIDTGSRGDGEAVLPLLEERGWKLRAIFNTHAHVDHIGGNRYLHERTGCPVYAPPLESFFAENPGIGLSILFGATVPDELRGRFFTAEGCPALPFGELPEGLEAVPLPGHSHDMYGFRTADGVMFLADSLVSGKTLDRYHISFVFNVGAYLETLGKVGDMRASLFIPSHADAAEEIAPLARKNADKTFEIADVILEVCREPAGFEEVLRAVFGRFGLRMSIQQYVMVGCTVRSYLSWLRDCGRCGMICEKDRLLWRSV